MRCLRTRKLWSIILNRLLLSGAGLLILSYTLACGNGNDGPTGSDSWNCSVTLTLVPSSIGGVSSPSGSGSGSGTGGSRDEALGAALKTACAQLNLDSDTRSLCESGRDFTVSVSSGGITLGSGVDRSIHCGN